MSLTSAHWGTYHVHVKDGRLTGLSHFAEDSDPTEIGKGIVDVIDDESRIIAPMIRKSWLDHGPASHPERRGLDPFVRVSWDQADQIVAAELERVISAYGNEAIYAGSYGWASAGRFHHAPGQLHRFLNSIGGYTKSVNTYSFAAAEVIVPHVIGHFRNYIYNQTSWKSVRDHAQLFVAFGGVPLKNGQIGQGGLGRHIQKESILAAHQNGVEFVSVSPLRSDMIDDVNASWMPIRPNSDTALMIGLCHTLLDQGLHDRAFLDRYCVGFDAFADYLTGAIDGLVKDAAWAAALCNIEADAIKALAIKMAQSRTMLSFSWSLTRQAHGEQPFWAGITLAAMLGQIGLPGGGFGFGYSAVNTVGNDIQRLPVAAMPQGRNAVSSFIPVARIADMLLNPGDEFDYDGTRYHYPDIKMIYWAGGNPFHHHQDLNRLLTGWQKPETIIAHEWCWNALAKHADIVLPCTTTLEREDIAMSPMDNYFVSMQAAIAPVVEARDDFEIFRGIAGKMGAEDAFTEGRTAEDWQRWLYDMTKQAAAQQGHELPSYDAFRQDGWFKLEPPEKAHVMFADFRADPVANPLATPSGKIEIYSATIAGFAYDDCAPHACWFDPPEWLGSHDRGTRLHLLGNQPTARLHSQLDHGSISRAAKIGGHEPVKINRQDAAARGIQTGDIVRLYNDRGACLCGAIVSDEVMEGVLIVSTGAWFDPDFSGTSGLSCHHGNPNVLTPDIGTSKLAQGPAAHSCLVEVELWTGGPVTMTAHKPPVISDGREISGQDPT
jgi:biotin/methionine sulfoxide reductase